MFHFLVKHNGWAHGHDTIGKGRVFEYTDDSLVQRFGPAGNLDYDALTRLPALFVSEVTGPGDQRARVGAINRVWSAGREVNISYTFEPDVPAIANSNLERIAASLGIQGFEFARTHWAIKDFDLFRALFLRESLIYSQIHGNFDAFLDSNA